VTATLTAAAAASWPTLAQLLDRHEVSRPDHPATVCGEHRSSYSQLADRVQRLAAGLGAAGVSQGDRVLWLGQNCHRVLELTLACSSIGAMLCPANWRGSAAELAFTIDDLRPGLVVWQRAEIGDQVAQARTLAAHDCLWRCHDDPERETDSYEELLAQTASGATPRQDDPDAPVYVIYTAAHEGRPGGSMLTSVNLGAQAAAIAPLFGTDDRQVFLNSGPLFHIGTAQHMITTLFWGGTNVFARRNDPIELCQLIQAERCTSAFLVPPQVLDILAADPEQTYDLTSLRSPLTMIPGWRERVSPDESAWGRLMGGYGQTEVTGLCVYAALGPDDDYLPTAGRPVPFVEVDLVGPDDQPVVGDEPGEIVVRGSLVHAGYWNRDEENLRRFRTGGWHTTDLGRRLPDGRIAFVGTATRMIKSAAENIYPAEVEAALISHPGVREVAVIGVPDERWVQSVRAIVVRAPGEVGRSLDEDTLVSHCRSRIASFKKPRSVVFVDALPRTGGVVDYSALDAAHGGGAYVGGMTHHGASAR
jgi:acyl-CoA synthetase (AMP-forming)/AMP-acid ligase II